MATKVDPKILKAQIYLTAKLASADLLRAAAPGVFAGGGYGLLSGLLNPGNDDRGERRSALKEALKRAIVGATVGGTLTSQFPKGVSSTEEMLDRGVRALGDTVRNVRERQYYSGEAEQLLNALIKGE